MKKMIMLGVLVLVLFLVSCAPAEEVSDDELEQTVQGMSDEELDAAITQGEAAENQAIAGQASKIAVNRFNVGTDKGLKVFYKEKAERLISKEFTSPALNPAELDVATVTFPDDAKDLTVQCKKAGIVEFRGFGPSGFRIRTDPLAQDDDDCCYRCYQASPQVVVCGCTC